MEHPSIYKEILCNADHDLNKKVEIGLQALEQIDKNYKIRSEIALQVAEYAHVLGKQDVVENCWLESLRSNTTALNYLRISLESSDKQLRDEAYELCDIYLEQMRGKKVYGDEVGELASNYLSPSGYNYLLFFHGKIEQLLDEKMNSKEPLGWSLTFMKEGISILLLLLYKETKMQTGTKKMLEQVVHTMNFSKEQYRIGMEECSVDMSDLDLFWNRFCMWKQDIVISEQLQKKIIKKLDTLVASRVEGIIGKNRTNYYGECAQFIAALAEVKESLGLLESKNTLLLEYKKRYPRRSSLIAQLKEYGMCV